MPQLDVAVVDKIISRIGTSSDAVIPLLQAIQTEFRYLPEEALRRVCETTDITPASLAGVSTFYSQFRHRPVGKHMICVCHGTACHVKGSGLIQSALEYQLRIPQGDDTDGDGLFTVEKVACLGCCTLAPVIQIDDVTYGRLAPNQVPDVLDDFLKRKEATKGRPRGRAVPCGDGFGEIRIGLGSCCVAQGSGDVHQAVNDVLARSGAPAVVKRVGCVGMCHRTPLMEIVVPEKEASFYANVDAETARRVVLDHFRPKGVIRRASQKVSDWLDYWVSDENRTAVESHALDVRDGPVCAFLGRQRHLATDRCGQIDPTDLDEYRRHGGFEGLRKSLFDMSPEEIIDAVRTSGLRGRGGAGFPTGEKWAAVRKAEGDLKYIVCNGDEGDPGAFMDRMLLESFPYRVLEGMIIAAKAVGASEGFLYIRAEYPLAVKRIREALETCEKEGLLGDDILGSRCSLKLSIKEGAGAFVCGEETALLASIEGRRGMPRLRPPYPAESGLWGRPTSVNNVETYSLLPWIFRNSAEHFAKLGTHKSKGTKVFALAGKVLRGGLIEVPMGITLREIVEEIGGGVAGGKKLKAVQVGGPSGGCVPESLMDTPVDFEALGEIGAIMGSGGLVVLDESDCMVDIARYFLEFTQDQSCGKCTFCRIGTRRMLDILERICEGNGRRGDLDTLEELAQMTKAGSICGLGKTAPNPVLSTLHYFRDEYEAHLEGRCPAGKCKSLIEYGINEDCIGCTLCAQVCPADAIPMTPYVRHVIDNEKCTRCDSCRGICPTKAIWIGDRQ